VNSWFPHSIPFLSSTICGKHNTVLGATFKPCTTTLHFSALLVRLFPFRVSPGVKRDPAVYRAVLSVVQRIAQERLVEEAISLRDARKGHASNVGAVSASGKDALLAGVRPGHMGREGGGFGGEGGYQTPFASSRNGLATESPSSSSAAAKDALSGKSAVRNEGGGGAKSSDLYSLAHSIYKQGVRAGCLPAHVLGTDEVGDGGASRRIPTGIDRDGADLSQDVEAPLVRDPPAVPGHSTIDLHGVSTAVARTALSLLLEEIFQGRRRSADLYIITGRGNHVHSSGKRAVLKEDIEYFFLKDMAPQGLLRTRQVEHNPGCLLVKKSDIDQWVIAKRCFS